jgi:hypothetical protein
VVREDKAVLEKIDVESLRSRDVKTGRSVNLVMRAQPWPADSAVPVVS